MSPIQHGMKVEDHEENGLVGADDLFMDQDDPAPEDEIVLKVIFFYFKCFVSRKGRLRD